MICSTLEPVVYPSEKAPSTVLGKRKTRFVSRNLGVGMCENPRKYESHRARRKLNSKLAIPQREMPPV